MVNGPSFKLPLWQRHSGIPYRSEWTTILHLLQSCNRIHQYLINSPSISIFTLYIHLSFALPLPPLLFAFASYTLLTVYFSILSACPSQQNLVISIYYPILTSLPHLRCTSSFLTLSIMLTLHISLMHFISITSIRFV
jgi:hypothetical protein